MKHMNHHKTKYLLAGSILVVIATGVYYQKSAESVNQPMRSAKAPIGSGFALEAAEKTEYERQMVKIRRRFAWTEKPWTASEKPFQTMRQATYEYFTQGKLTPAYFLQVEARAKKNPRDAKAQYLWGYAFYRAPVAGIKINNFFAASQSIIEAMNKAPNPHSFEYDRLRYLLYAGIDRHHFLKGLAARLLRRYPHDYHVKYEHAVHLSAESLKERKLALSYARQLIKAQPNNLRSHEALGNAHLGIYILEKRSSDFDKAMAAFNKQLALTPKNDPTYVPLQNYMQSLKKDRQKLIKYG